MRLSEIAGTHQFRSALWVTGAFSLVILCLFGFVYWQTAWLETSQIDSFINHEVMVLKGENPSAMRSDVNARYRADLHRQSFAAIFDEHEALLAGGLVAIPRGLRKDGRVHACLAMRSGDTGMAQEQVRAVAVGLPNGLVLVVGRSAGELVKLRLLLLQALGLGAIPALAAALAIGLLSSQRMLSRVDQVNHAIKRIMQGHLQERLPLAGTQDAFERLAASCNLMLEEIETLLGEVKAVGDNIVHDVRAPLARMRARLETGLARAQTAPALHDVMRTALADLDQCLSIMQALSRIGELEAGRRQANFESLNLASLVDEAADLYRPLLEHRGLTFHLTIQRDHEVCADRQLLLEAVANLLDNAAKFAPAEGAVTLALLFENNIPLIRVADTGAGIAPDERGAVLGRFYRGRGSFHIAGSGVGLSLVCAIMRLHGFHLRMSDGDFGFAVDILCD